MHKIKAELLGKPCDIIVEFEECIRVYSVLRRLIDRCNGLDVEHVAVLEEGKILDLNDEICRDSFIRVVRLLRGG